MVQEGEGTLCAYVRKMSLIGQKKKRHPGHSYLESGSRREEIMSTQPSMLGVSAAIRSIEEEIGSAARSGAKVLITGESGVGKEMVARFIHERSDRRMAPLIPINCAGIPDSLLESEFFGHVRGGFTDAHRDKAGLLERAHGGTLFMDEVGEMSLRMQALLLRFLETGEIQRVGSDRLSAPLEVRIIAATHRRLIDLVADQRFREDLYYRLNVIHIDVPPLRDRPEDVEILLSHFLQQFARTNGAAPPFITDEAILFLTRYAWPGNVRELRNVAERLVLRGALGPIEADTLPHEIVRHQLVQPLHAAESLPTMPRAQVLLEQIRFGGSFWAIAYEPFMARDLTRGDIRELVRLGLEQSRGNYKLLVTSFNMAAGDYKKFVNFLHKYQCHVPFQAFRMAPANGGRVPPVVATA
jgi:DNA-binding NtrC family response regulator